MTLQSQWLAAELLLLLWHLCHGKLAAVLSTSSFLQIPAESSLPSDRLIMSSTATAQKWLVPRSLAIVQPNLLSGECEDAVSLMGRWSQGSRQRWKTLRQKGGTSIMTVQQCSRAALGLSDPQGSPISHSFQRQILQQPNLTCCWNFTPLSLNCSALSLFLFLPSKLPPPHSLCWINYHGLTLEWPKLTSQI